MTANECVDEARRAGAAYQRAINQFVDDFRRASPERRRALERRSV
jgi:hypothetical protein